MQLTGQGFLCLLLQQVRANQHAQGLKRQSAGKKWRRVASPVWWSATSKANVFGGMPWGIERFQGNFAQGNGFGLWSKAGSQTW